MKLLFDEHLSRRLVTRLADIYPSASHIVLQGLEHADDSVIWRFAATEGYTIVTKDADFNDMATLRGVPPRIIWLQIGNCTTATIEKIMRDNVGMIEQFVNDPQSSVLKLV
jgi:predicted nuclease of predicted toxin-antitoxin system